MKTNFLFLSIILIVLIGECFAHDQIDRQQAEFWSNNLRIISWILMGMWFYQLQKCNFKLNQNFFLLSILLPIIVSLTSFLLPEHLAIIINIGVNIIVFLIWIYYFHALGAKIILRDADNNFQKVVPAFLIFPICFYFLSLYQSLIGIYALIVFIYVIVFSYTGILAVFLPVAEERRLYIVLGISLLAIANIMNAYHTFLEKLFWVYPVIRTITVSSKCMLIYGIIDCGINEKTSLNKGLSNVEI